MKSNITLFLAKLDKEKPYIVNKNQFEINLDKYETLEKFFLSKDFTELVFHLNCYLFLNTRFVKKTKKSKIWIIFEYNKPLLWSFVDYTLILQLLYNIIKIEEKNSNVTQQLINKLYIELENSLTMCLDVEQIAIDIALSKGKYINLNTQRVMDMEYFSVYRLINNKTIDSYVVLDSDSKDSIKDQLNQIATVLK